MPKDPDPPVDMAETFGQVARLLLHEADVTATLQRVVALAVESLEPCEFAGISYVVKRRITSPASSNEVPRVLDRLQAELDEGPCIDAIREHEVVRTGDLTSEARWPEFSHRAHAETGVSSILSVRLFAEEETMGALNLYSTRMDAFGDVDIALAAVFATHAAVAMQSARREENLERKAATREVIGRAKGILMGQLRVTEDEAFAILRKASQQLNLKLLEVAERVIFTGEAPA